MIKSAILFLVFNRPDTTFKVFKKIREIKPSKLYVASDGPRKGFKGEKERVLITRQIATSVDWPCEVIKLFRDSNLGCKKGVSEAITWFFKQEKMGIILEDDCVPHSDFFNFCDILLHQYSEDDKISAITGNNFQDGRWRGNNSYYFSKFPHCWGWATWKRSWKIYDGDINFWPKWKNSTDFLNYIPDRIEQKYWQKIFDSVYEGKVDSWAYPWTACNWYNKKLTITPNVNLVSNIGFDERATHTKLKNDKNANLKTFSLQINKHPQNVKRNIQADNWTFNFHFEGRKLRFPYNWFLFPHRLVKFFYRKITSNL